MSEIGETSVVANVDAIASNVTSLYSSDEALAWADDPIADEEWTAEYEEELRQREIFEEEMQKRLEQHRLMNGMSSKTCFRFRVSDFFKSM